MAKPPLSVDEPLTDAPDQGLLTGDQMSALSAKLTRAKTEQERVRAAIITAVMAGSSTEDAARELGVHERTAYRAVAAAQPDIPKIRAQVQSMSMQRASAIMQQLGVVLIVADRAVQKALADPDPDAETRRWVTDHLRSLSQAYRAIMQANQEQVPQVAVTFNVATDEPDLLRDIMYLRQPQPPQAELSPAPDLDST